jgi:acetolactate synthase-1/2/3 large subunit
VSLTRKAGDPAGADAVVRALEDEDIPFTFGIPGTHNIELYDRLSSSNEVTAILVTDEQSASFMADGLWRASGRLGCVNLVPGAGLTHALSGIAEAYLDHVPMLVLGCGIRRDTGHAFQLHDVDQMALARPVTKGAFRPVRGRDIYPTIRRACALARAGAPGPVLVEIPANLYLRPTHDPEDRPPEAVTGPEPAPAPSEEDIRRLAGALLESRRPLLYLGAGAAPAAGRLVELAELLESPVATTLQGKGVFPESHPLWLWPGFGRAAPPFVRRIAAGCDATLAIGCRFAEVGTGSYGLDPPRPLLHVDIDPAALDANFESDLSVIADSALLVPALLDALRDMRGRSEGAVSRADGGLRSDIAAGLETVRREQRVSGDDSRVTPARLLESLQRHLGPGTVFATDSGNGTFLAAEMLVLDRPGRFLAPVDYSCMGYAVPAAIGASLGRPGTPVVALVGDGAFLMTGLEMLTAAQLGLPVAFLVLRDRELAQIAQFQQTAYNRRESSAVPDYDLASVARGLGLEALPLGDDASIHGVVEEMSRLLARGSPVVVDVDIDYSRKTWFTRGVVRTNLGRLPWNDRLRMVGRALVRRLTG